MKTIKTFKANPIGSSSVESLRIEFSKPIPKIKQGPAYYGKFKKIYKHEATEIVEVLRETLPAAFVKELLIALLARSHELSLEKPTNN